MWKELNGENYAAFKTLLFKHNINHFPIAFLSTAFLIAISVFINEYAKNQIFKVIKLLCAKSIQWKVMLEIIFKMSYSKLFSYSALKKSFFLNIKVQSQYLFLLSYFI